MLWSTATAETIRTAGSGGKGDGKDSVYETLQLMLNWAVIGVLSTRFYGYALKNQHSPINASPNLISRVEPFAALKATVALH